MTLTEHHDLRLIEAGFPCHQVGAETQRERGASSALPPLYFLHVWWARRPLTPSRAAILGSILPADTDPDWFLQELGIEKRVVRIGDQEWVLTGKVLDLVEIDEKSGDLFIPSTSLMPFLNAENLRRSQCRSMISKLEEASSSLAKDAVLLRWKNESEELNNCDLPEKMEVCKVPADPYHIKERIEFAQRQEVVSILGSSIKWNPENLYGYTRAFTESPSVMLKGKKILDLTSGGGSIPFEGLRCGCDVVANELNPVATAILHGTLSFPFKFGVSLCEDIERWGQKLVDAVSLKMEFVTPFSEIPRQEVQVLRKICGDDEDLFREFSGKEYDQTGILFTRQVICPHCGGDAPLLNTCWLAKGSGDKWGVEVITDGSPSGGKVRFKTYPVVKGKGPEGQNPELSTVARGVGQCVHCRQTIDADEIKRQARGESPHGRWKDVLYAVAAVRYQPKLDGNGDIQRYKTGAKAGQIKTEKVRFFRPPNQADLAALDEAQRTLEANWDRWDDMGLIPTESFPQGNDMRPAIYGMSRWCDMFTPRQLLGHLTLIEELNSLKPRILSELGEERGRAVVTYLQFAIDKGLDYNSRQTLWHASRGVIAHTFTRHDFSLKWTMGELIFSGENSGFAWGLSQVIDAYKGIAELADPIRKATGGKPPVTIVNGTAAHMESVDDRSVDVICFDPPYYNNVQYAELSDYFYVWQRRTLFDLYPDLYRNRLTNKADEAVANPDRDGGAAGAKAAYERTMGEIFQEARRVLKDDGIMTMMFTHKSQNAWETLTIALIENGWVITSSMPVESESARDIHHKEMAAGVSSIFISCRKRSMEEREPSLWSGFGGVGVQQEIRSAVSQGLEDFRALRLNPVDEMVGSYGRALRVLSENWPVMDGEERVSPVRAMNEASQVVAQNRMARITGGHLKMEDLSPEAGMALTMLGIFGLGQFPYSEALNLSRSLGIALEVRNGGYSPDGRFIGINDDIGGRRSAQGADDGYFAPLVKKGSSLRIALPEERSARRVQSPKTEWDVLQGLIMAYREGDVPVARGYLERNGSDNRSTVVDLLRIWADQVGDETLRKEAEFILFGLKE
ncbi:DUF1156 domain-containing protein [Dethiosulfovibrio salsuginis]|uniref:Adenine-specific DNA methylase, contains a Zn-ribbon domain n=1 Tax=Dethiosulfovibrio salsuginis TaxID=561720 RepID=A0A1X7IGT3_9BACT|nr:DUF1156 domain-containing protein [Dethiosulfovibrio salsuginis]SMG13617.1 Adenine-specific DNA methylase, contains a Zn-ribbon domain [Dethiosulfovibrio salsuginis]